MENKIKYYSLNTYLQDKYGCKLYKVPIDGGFTCPNRDGSKDYRGCIFCSASGSGDFIRGKNLTIGEQIELGIKMLDSKFRVDDKKERYIAYFQAYTNTYSDIEDLRRKYFEALNNDKIKIVSIATRPDCLGKEVLELLKEINEIKPVWVELGLQTVKKESIEYIRRCYENEVYETAVSSLYDIGITQIITHIILGLPGETKEDMINTTEFVSNIIKKNGYSPDMFGYKFQLLHVLKGTDLLSDYNSGKFDVLSLEEYIDILKACISKIDPNSVVHRLTGDGDKKILVAPLWSGDKKTVLNAINREFIKI